MFDCHRYVKCPNVGFCFMSAISVCCSWLLRIWADTINLAALWESRQTICFLFSRGLFSYSWSLQEPSLKLNRWDICFQMSRVRRTKNMKVKAKNLHKNAYFCFCLVPLSCPWCNGKLDLLYLGNCGQCGIQSIQHLMFSKATSSQTRQLKMLQKYFSCIYCMTKLWWNAW